MSSPQKTFYIETFGCQMNFHDSEKVVGTLISEGYAQVQREEDADLIFYNTCSIRDKAEQKVFHRLNDFKKLHKEGKRFAVLGCVAQQEGEKIFERAPYVSLVAGSASYRNLPAMLVQIEAGRRTRHRTRRSPDRPDLRDRVHRPHQSASRIHHHHRRLRQVLRLLRGAVHARQGAQPHLAVGAGRSPAHGRRRLHRHSTARAKRELLPRSGREEELRRIAGGRRGIAGHSPRALHHLASARLHQRHHRRDRRACPTLCDHVHLPVQSGSSRVLESMFREYTREQYLERIAWMKAARNREISITTDVIVGFPGETEAEFARDAEPARRSRLRRRVLVQVFAAAEHARAAVRRLHSRRREIAPPAGSAGASARAAESKLSQAFRADCLK